MIFCRSFPKFPYMRESSDLPAPADLVAGDLVAGDDAPPGRNLGMDGGETWLKVDFHIHTGEDPFDELDFSASELLYGAHALGFHAVAITHHGTVFSRPEVAALACELGVLLIPAGEIRIEGADVVVLNISPEEATGLRSWGDLAALRRRRGESVFIIAAHPFYRLGGSIGRERLKEKLALFDAIEQCHLHTRFFDLNAPARAVARGCGKPLVATSDTHRLSHFGRHYTRVKARQEGGAAALFAAIRAGNVECVSPRHSLWGFLEYAWWIFAVHEVRLLQARYGRGSVLGEVVLSVAEGGGKPPQRVRYPERNGETLLTPRLPEGGSV